jgi:ATP-binding cassette subfamily B protein
MHASNLAVQAGLADLSSQLQETISGITVVKAYAMEETTRERFQAATEELYHRKLAMVKVMGAMPAVTSLLPALAMWIVFLVGGWEISAGRMGIAVFFTFAIYIAQLTFPSFIMGWVFALVQRGAASMQRLDEVLSTEPSIADRPDQVQVGALRGEIEFRGLHFRYPGSDREPALEDVSLRVPAGSVLGVVGPVGSGKTTLASLIPRLYEVEDGMVFLDGVDVNRLPLATLRSHIAMVPQDSFLFSMSLADNIAYGLEASDPARVAEAAQRAQLVKDVVELPNGYETVVGERGVMLSGGQRQRAALARALCLRPSVLILDDTLSSVDAETEAAIQKELEQVFRERTVVVVASRVSTVRGADLIVVLDAGRIVERGTHQELIELGGLYARLAREQERERELESLDSALGVA